MRTNWFARLFDTKDESHVRAVVKEYPAGKRTERGWRWRLVVSDDVGSDTIAVSSVEDVYSRWEDAKKVLRERIGFDGPVDVRPLPGD